MSSGKLQPVHYDKETLKELTKQVCTTRTDYVFQMIIWWIMMRFSVGFIY